MQQYVGDASLGSEARFYVDRGCSDELSLCVPTTMAVRRIVAIDPNSYDPPCVHTHTAPKPERGRGHVSPALLAGSARPRLVVSSSRFSGYTCCCGSLPRRHASGWAFRRVRADCARALVRPPFIAVSPEVRGHVLVDLGLSPSRGQDPAWSRTGDSISDRPTRSRAVRAEPPSALSWTFRQDGVPGRVGGDSARMTEIKRVRQSCWPRFGQLTAASGRRCLPGARRRRPAAGRLESYGRQSPGWHRGPHTIFVGFRETGVASCIRLFDVRGAHLR
jgi:hypothetical protein